MSPESVMTLGQGAMKIALSLASPRCWQHC